MHQIKLAVASTVILLASGCVGTGQYGPKARAINYDEASSFERSLQADAAPAPKQPAILYTQPVNKKEPCKLPTTEDQLERGNFKAYWDGQCKDGFAYGLGRDIAISDTHHVEEIVKHNGPDSYDNQSPRVDYDFVQNRIIYSSPTGKSPSQAWLIEEISNDRNNFYITYSLGVTDESDNRYGTTYSPLSPTKIFVNDQRNVRFKFSDNSARPAVKESDVTFVSEIIDLKTNTVGGVVVKYANGQIRHAIITNGVTENIELPAAYINNLNEKLNVIKTRLTQAQKGVEQAQQMEREYLYLACNGKHVIDGLDNKTATKICNWRDQFKDPYEKALTKYTHDLDQLKQQAEVVAQQRITQQQINIQQRQQQRQQAQQDVDQISNALGQFGQQMQNSSQQMMNSVMSRPAPQVNFGQQGSNQITCVNAGIVTNCRY